MKTLNKKLTYLAETKAAIKTAIVEKGQTVEDTDTFRSYADKIRAIEAGGGGGSVEGTATVTFCNYDGTELFSRPVFVGDNCPDPIAQGKINEPTRESSAQYTYAYSGWSLTAGGTASASALNVVTGDRTVYAAYTQNVRYYTARFYDGTTLMKEPQLVAYGSKATPPETLKTGYEFVGWTPSDLTIYGDTDFYGEWVEFRGYTLNFTLTATSSDPGVVYGKSGKYFAVQGQYKIEIYDVTTTQYTLVKTIEKPDQYIYDCAFSDDESLFAIAYKYSSRSYVIDLWETASWTRKHRFDMKSNNSPNSLTFARGNEFLYVGAGYNELYKISDLSTVSISTSITNGERVCSAGDFLFSANITGGVKCYKYNDGVWGEILLDGVPTDGAVALAVTNSGRKVFVLTNASAGNNAFTLTYDETTETYTYDGYLTNVLLKPYNNLFGNDAVFNHEGSVLAVGLGIKDGSTNLTLIDMTTTPETQYFNPDTMPQGWVSGLSYSANGAHFAYACGWDVYVFNTR